MCRSLITVKLPINTQYRYLVLLSYLRHSFYCILKGQIATVGNHHRAARADYQGGGLRSSCHSKSSKTSSAVRAHSCTSLQANAKVQEASGQRACQPAAPGRLEHRCSCRLQSACRVSVLVLCRLFAYCIKAYFISLLCRY